MKRFIQFTITLRLPDGEKWPDDTTEPKKVTMACRIDTPDEAYQKLADEIRRNLHLQIAQWARQYIHLEWRFLHKVLPEDLTSGVSNSGKYWRSYNGNNLKNGLANDSFSLSFRKSIHAPTNMTFMISNLNMDAKAMFHTEDFVSDPDYYQPDHNVTRIDFYDVWDYHPCMIKTDLANGVQHNYLGYSHVRYDPVKYYRINNSDNMFSIELFNGHYSNIPSILPFDDKETITIEYTILQNATQLYT
jgi:hypothetical protein